MKISLGKGIEFRNVVQELVIEQKGKQFKIKETNEGITIQALNGILISQASYQKETIQLKIKREDDEIIH